MGLKNISRSLLPWILGRMPAGPAGLAMELSQEQILDWALSQGLQARALLAEDI